MVPDSCQRLPHHTRTDPGFFFPPAHSHSLLPQCHWIWGFKHILEGSVRLFVIGTCNNGSVSFNNTLACPKCFNRKDNWTFLGP